MPLITVHTYKNSAILVEIVINGSSTIGGFTSAYTVEGTLSNGSTTNLTANTTWTIIAGNTYASINSSGIVTNTNITNMPHYITIEAETTLNDITLTTTKVVSVTTVPDYNFNDISLLLSGDTHLQVADATINGPTSIAGGDSYDYSITGTFTDDSEAPVDNFTTWAIISGGDYATINETTGVVSVDNSLEGVHAVTIRAVTFYNGGTTETDLNITVIANDLDFYFSNTVMVLNGDSSLALVSTEIQGEPSVSVGSPHDYSILGTFSDSSVVSVDGSTTWSITSGNDHATINSTTGVVTTDGDITLPQNVTIQSSTTFAEDTIFDTKQLVVHGIGYDPYFTDISLILKGDIILSLVSVNITGEANVFADGIYDYTATGTFSDATSSNVDSITTWEIISGGSYGTINPTTGELTVNEVITGLQSITIRSTTIYDEDSIQSTKVLNVYGQGVDPYFTNASLILAGDSLLDLVSVTVYGSPSIAANSSFDYYAIGTFNDSTSSNVDGSTTWEVISGGAHGSINSTTGVYTANASITGIQNVTIRATSTFGETVVTDDFDILVHNENLDPYFTSASVMLSGDLLLSLNSVVINGDSNIIAGNMFDYSATGTFSDSSSANVDANTTWAITVGNDHATINSTTGVVTADGDVTGIQSVTIESTTVMYGDTVYATKNVSIYGLDLDPNFSSNSLLLTGDFDVNLLSTQISGADAVQASGSFDYSISGAFSDNTNAGVDAETTWEITVGGAYASINSATGVLTANGGITGSHAVTIKATTIHDGNTITTEKAVYVHEAGVDPYFTANVLLLAGDNNT